MKPQEYRKIYDWFTARPLQLQRLKKLNRWLPLCVAGLYIGVLFGMAEDAVLVLRFPMIFSAEVAAFIYVGLVKAVCVPAAVFLLGTLLRRVINAPRPYQQPGFEPLVQKEKQGQSFPSRHAVSAGAIAAVLVWRSPVLGVLGLVLAAAVCAARVLVGQHFVRDVVAGVVGGFVCGMVGLLLL